MYRMEKLGRLFLAACLSSAVCTGLARADGFRVEDGKLVVESPFDLALGSTNYAVRLGKAVRSTTSATYDPDTKVTTTNWSAYGSVRLSAPYHGVKSVSLAFKGKERRLDSYNFHIGEKKHGIGGTLTVDECRKVMKEVADDFTSANREVWRRDVEKFCGKVLGK